MVGQGYSRGQAVINREVNYMSKILLNKSDLDMARKVAYYYRYPQRVSEYDKILLNEAKARNNVIHYKALQINRAIWCKGLSNYV